MTRACYVRVSTRHCASSCVDPNPARDRRVKTPTVRAQEPNPPTGRQFLAIVDGVEGEWRLPLVVSEQTGMYLAEVLQLRWGYVDVAERKLRLRYDYVKRGIRTRARTVRVRDWLVDAIEDRCALEDRVADRRVFGGCGRTPGAAR
jgi:integrase